MRPREKGCLVTQVCMVQFPFLPRGALCSTAGCQSALHHLPSLLMLSALEDRLLHWDKRPEEK